MCGVQDPHDGSESTTITRVGAFEKKQGRGDRMRAHAQSPQEGGGERVQRVGDAAPSRKERP